MQYLKIPFTTEERGKPGHAYVKYDTQMYYQTVEGKDELMVMDETKVEILAARLSSEVEDTVFAGGVVYSGPVINPDMTLQEVADLLATEITIDPIAPTVMEAMAIINEHLVDKAMDND